MTTVQLLRELIFKAKTQNMEINELTVSAAQYEILKSEAIVTARFYDERTGEYALRFNDVTINKRKCKGCCSHG